jgi:hypothetical protein
LFSPSVVLYKARIFDNSTVLWLDEEEFSVAQVRVRENGETVITTVVTAATITTITTVTTTTVTTVATVLAMGLGAAVGIVAIVGFGVLLGAKELAGAVRTRSGTSVRMARFLGVGIWPLAIAFGVFVATRVIQIIA